MTKKITYLYFCLMNKSKTKLTVTQDLVKMAFLNHDLKNLQQEKCLSCNF